MSKTAEVIEKLREGKDKKEICRELDVSESLVSRCKKRLETETDEPKEEEVSDDEIDSYIKKIKITPEEKYLTKGKEIEEEFECGKCNHSWKSSKIPKKCPSCGCEFE